VNTAIKIEAARPGSLASHLFARFIPAPLPYAQHAIPTPAREVKPL